MLETDSNRFSYQSLFKIQLFYHSMDNFLLLERNSELEKLSSNLGFTKTYFLEDFTLITAETKKQLLTKLKTANPPTIYRPPTEDLLRFAVEKTSIDIILGIEKIHAKDSLHYLRGGLDQVLCKIAKGKNKTIAFSFSDILNSTSRSKLLARMAFNLKLCKKYKINVLFSNFSSHKEEIRSAKDLEAFLKLLSKCN
jgi:RNase P/RNase MRP subunit p30